MKPYYTTAYGEYYVEGSEKERVAREVAKLSPRRVLDLGCGPGFFSYYLARMLPDAEVVGLDADAQYISTAIDTWSRENLSFGLYDLTTPPSAHRKPFDVIIFSEVIEHLEDVGAALSIIRTHFCHENTVFIVTTDNAFSFYGLLGELWRGYTKPPIQYNEWYESEGRHVPWSHHLYTWDAKSLATILHLKGFSTTAYYHEHHHPLMAHKWRIPFHIVCIIVPALREKIVITTKVKK